MSPEGLEGTGLKIWYPNHIGVITMVAARKPRGASATKAPGKGMAPKQNTAMAAMAEDFAADADAGFENTSAADYAIPFLIVLQKGSPVCDEDHAKFTKGAKQGQLMNSVTEQRFDARMEDKESVLLIPCAYMRQFIEWKRRDDGGGFVGVHDVAAGEAL